jgi:hypothetical protein
MPQLRLPVFLHLGDDLAAFKRIVSQFYINGNARIDTAAHQDLRKCQRDLPSPWTSAAGCRSP